MSSNAYSFCVLTWRAAQFCGVSSSCRLISRFISSVFFFVSHLVVRAYDGSIHAYVSRVYRRVDMILNAERTIAWHCMEIELCYARAWHTAGQQTNSGIVDFLLCSAVMKISHVHRFGAGMQGRGKGGRGGGGAIGRAHTFSACTEYVYRCVDPTGSRDGCAVVMCTVL